MKQLILASTSPRRQELFAAAGIPFDIVASSYEEDMSLPLTPRELAKQLSRGKAEAVAAHYPNAVVIGADTFVALGDRVLGKPHTAARASEMLHALSGTTHAVITGFTIIDQARGKMVSEAIESTLQMKPLSDDIIDAYIATGEPLDKAGAYAVQGIGGAFFERIEGDMSNIIGLPVMRILERLAEFGIRS